MFVSKAAMWWFFLETKVGPARRVGARRALLSSPGGLVPRHAPLPGPGPMFVSSKMRCSFFSRRQRSLSLDRTRVRLKTHLGRTYYSTPVLCCQVQDGSRIGRSRTDAPPHTTWRGEETATPSRAHMCPVLRPVERLEPAPQEPVSSVAASPTTL
jgi:hypothetical protein